MGLKQAAAAAADGNTDPKKRRRVGFSVIDAGVEANDCIQIFLVGRKEEVDAPDSISIDPIDLNRFFGEDGKIYGYTDLKIKIWLSSVSFHAYADISFQSSSDGGKGITDLNSSLQKIFGETLINEKNAFLQTFVEDCQYIRNVISKRELLDSKAAEQHDDESKSQLEGEASTIEVIRMPVNSMLVGELYSRLVPLVLLLVDGSSPIDVTDSRWEIYLMVNKTDLQGDGHIKLLGFATVYRFYHYPDSSRLRISQILVLPPYQGQGHGRHLLEVLNSVAISEKVYDMAIEEPSEYLQHVRTVIDTNRLLAFSPIKGAVDTVCLHLREKNLSKKTSNFDSDPPTAAVEEVRKTFKINKKQFLQCWEVLIYLGLDPANHLCMENYRTLIADRTRADILGKDSGTGGKQVIDVPNDYDNDMTFVMFRPRAGEQVDSLSSEINKNQAEIEVQLNQVVDERLKEITEVAERVVSLRQSNSE